VLDRTKSEARLQETWLVDEIEQAGDRYVTRVDHSWHDVPGLCNGLRSSLGAEWGRASSDETKCGPGDDEGATV
jgi:hypothetical protein